MMLKEKLLLIPGPSPVRQRVLDALAAPTVAHTSPEMQSDLREACADLKRIVSCASGEAFIIAGAGTLSMEMAVLNTASERGRALVLSQGYFGARMAEIYQAFGLAHDVVRSGWGQAVLPGEVEERLATGRYDTVVCTHVDTATGACAPVEAYARVARARNALFIVDGVCATGGIPERMDEWAIDVVLTAAQKCIGVPPGLALCVFSERAMARRRSRNAIPAYYADVLRWLPVMHDPAKYFSTPCVNEIRAFREGTRIVFEEGLEARFRRHDIQAVAVRAGLAALGFLPFTAAPFLASTLTVVSYPEGVDDKAFRAALDARGVVVAGGLAETAGKVFRMGHMGNLTDDDVLFALEAAEGALGTLDVRFERGAAVRAGAAVLDGGRKETRE